MWRLLILACLLAVNSAAAYADDVFSCGGADVRFKYEKRHQIADYVSVDVIISRDGRQSVLRYDGNVDFVGGVCVKDGRGNPAIVFQVYCGGSGCMDLDNWGIVDPSDLRVLLVPNDWNRKDARKIFGRTLPKIDNMINLEDVGRELGIK